MSDPQPQPQPTGSDTNWAAFEDLLDADHVIDVDEDQTQIIPTPDAGASEVPVYGWRILCTLDENGERWYRWSLTGDPELQETVATFERIKFVLQANEYASHTSNGAG